VHVNRQQLLGRISSCGAELRYNAKGTPYCSLTLETDKIGPDGQKTYTSYHRVEITGRLAEDLSVTLEAGDEILVEGEHQYRSSVDPKTQAKKTTCVLSTGWVNQRQPALAGVAQDERSASPEYPEQGDESVNAHKPKKGRPRYPKWTPAA
jgi:single-stranded DNA-binding protein